MMRWGIPWYRVNPAPEEWDFSWLDQVVDRFEELGLEPIVDLMHYGTPPGSRTSSSTPTTRSGSPSTRAGRRALRGALEHYTPLNEPLLNVIYCGQFGYWPPYLRGDDGFVQLTRAISKGIVLTQQAIAVADPEADFVHVEASFRFLDEEDAFPEEVRTCATAPT